MGLDAGEAPGLLGVRATDHVRCWTPTRAIVIQTVPIGNGPDGAGFRQPARDWRSAPDGDGHADGGAGVPLQEKYEVAETVAPRKRGARTMAVDCKADKISCPPRSSDRLRSRRKTFPAQTGARDG